MAPVFEYEARDKKGEKINGDLMVENPTLVAKQLREKGYFVTSINEKTEKKDLGEYFKSNKRVKISDLAIFSQQFSVMINAGITLVEVLEVLQKQTDHPKLKEVISHIQEDVETGSGLSEAMLKYPDVFPNLYCQMVKAGETGGVLDKVLNQLAHHYQRQNEITKKLKSALYYPLTILVVAIIVIVFLITQVVPTFISIFASMGGQLPQPTRVLLAISGFLRNYWWIICLIILGLILFIKSYKHSPKGRYRLDKLNLKSPLVGKMMQKIYISRFASTLAILLDSGVDLLSALTIVEDVVGNQVYAKVLTKARTQVREGVAFSKPLAESGIFPNMVVQMIRVGEEAGSIEEMLKKVSFFYDQEVESSIEGTVSLIEPIMIIILAILVGFIVVSIALPMFDMYSFF